MKQPNAVFISLALGSLTFLGACPAPSDMAAVGIDSGASLRSDAGRSPDASIPLGVDGAVGDAGVFDSADAGGWVSLFDGVSLKGWQRYLGPPNVGEPPYGLENDPKKVFSVVQLDGEAAIKISGEVWGSLTSKVNFSNFELEAEFKWGTAVFPPLNALDSGLMYFSFGPFGAVNAGGSSLAEPPLSGAFQVSMEYQLVPSDLGGMYNLGPIKFVAGPRTVRLGSDSGWNRLKIEAGDALVVHWLNDQRVAEGRMFSTDWPNGVRETVNAGALQLQSEGAEIYFRRLRIRNLR